VARPHGLRMTQFGILHDRGFQVYATENGIEKRSIGPRWPTPREADHFAELLGHREYVSPLRQPARSVPDAGERLRYGPGRLNDRPPAVDRR
jgi:hypothetical protein